MGAPQQNIVIIDPRTKKPVTNTNTNVVPKNNVTITEIKDPKTKKSVSDNIWQSQYQDAVNKIITNNPGLEKTLNWEMIEPGAKAINGRYKDFLITYKDNTKLHTALNNFQLASEDWAKSIKNMSDIQDKKNIKDFEEKIINYQNTWIALNKQTLTDNSPLKIYNGRLYDQKGFKKVNQYPYLANTGSADLLLKGAGPSLSLPTMLYSLTDYYKDTHTSASYERKNLIETQGRTEILKTLDPIYNSYVNKSFDTYDPKNVKANLISIKTANIYLDLITSVAKYGTLGDNNLQNKTNATTFLKQYNNAEPSDKSKLILANKDLVKTWTTDLSFHQKWNLFENAYNNIGTDLSLYPKKLTDPENKKSTTVLLGADWKLKADLLQIKFKTYKEYVAFESNYAHSAKEKFYTDFANASFLGNKNALNAAESKRLMESIFDEKTGNFMSFKTWDKNEANRTMGDDFVYKQIGREVESGWNESKDFVSNVYHMYEAFYNQYFGTPKDVVKSIAAIGGSSSYVYRQTMREKLFNDMQKIYKKKFDDVEFKNIKGYNKTTIASFKNIFNLDLFYTGLDLTLDQNNVVINNDEGKNTDAIKIINLLKANNDNTIWDTNMTAGITVLGDQQKKLGFHSITENQLLKKDDKLGGQSNAYYLKNFFKGKGLDDVKMMLHKNTSVKNYSRYEFIKNEGENNEESISMFIPKQLLGDTNKGINDYFFTATEETLAQTMFRLKGEEHEMGIVSDSNKKPIYDKATLSLKEENGQQRYVGTIVYEKLDGNTGIYEYNIPNGSFISFEDAYRNFDLFLHDPDLKASLLPYNANN